MKCKTLNLRMRLVYAFTAVLLCAVSVFGGWNYLPAYAADNGLSKFDETNVIDDLKSCEPFSFLRYPVNLLADPKIEVIEAVEYCYSYAANMRDNYALYLYVYNPTLLDIDITSPKNTVQMAAAYDSYPVIESSKATVYEKFALQFCSKAESGLYKNLFYKFKVIDHVSADGKTVGERVNSNGRRYDISGIELLTRGAATADDYPVKLSYTFTGYAKGCGPDGSTDNVTLKSKELKTITLELHDAFYRTGETSNYHRNQLNTVYFSVPEQYFTDYGALQKILAEWYEYKTDYIFVSSVADDSTAYPVVKPYIGVDIGNGNKDIPMEIYTGKTSEAGAGTVYGKVWNPLQNGLYTEIIPRIDWLLKTDKHYADYTPTVDELFEYIDWYKTTIGGSLIENKYPAELFVDSIDANRIELLENPADKRGYMRKEFDAGDEFNLLSYDSTHNGWQRFWDKFGRWPVDTGGGGVYAPIQEVSAADLRKGRPDFCKEFFIDDMYYEDFKTFADDALKNNRRPVLFRFAATDYYSQSVAFDSPENPWASKEDGYVAQETVFLDFDIIQLTFNKEGKLTAIPVVASPIDIFAPPQPPLDDGTGKDDWWKWVLMVLALILVVILLAPVLPLIVQFVVWIVLLPFKAIAVLFKAIGKAAKGKRKNE